MSETWTYDQIMEYRQKADEGLTEAYELSRELVTTDGFNEEDPIHAKVAEVNRILRHMVTNFPCWEGTNQVALAAQGTFQGHEYCHDSNDECDHSDCYTSDDIVEARNEGEQDCDHSDHVYFEDVLLTNDEAKDVNVLRERGFLRVDDVMALLAVLHRRNKAGLSTYDIIDASIVNLAVGDVLTPSPSY